MIENSKGKMVNPAVVEHMAMENEKLREALRPFAVFEAVRSKQGGCTPKSGTVWSLASNSEEAEITVEHLQAAVAALSQQAEPMCDTCHGQGEVWIGENQSFGYMSMQPPEPIMEFCPECGGEEEPARAQDEREIIGVERYRVVRYSGNFGIACVKAGDGERKLFQGLINDCERVAAELATAFEDGKFVAARPAQTEQQPEFNWEPIQAFWRKFNGVSRQTADNAQTAPQKYDDVLLPFLSMMRAELHANAGKGDRPGWLAMDVKTALLEIFYHIGKLQKAAKKGDRDGIREYSADVANMSMMLADICGVLPEHQAQTAPHPEQSGLVESALRKAVAYLDENPFNEIASGSILHRVMGEALSTKGGEK